MIEEKIKEMMKEKKKEGGGGLRKNPVISKSRFWQLLRLAAETWGFVIHTKEIVSLHDRDLRNIITLLFWRDLHIKE